jgi:hypothetical protein
MGGAAGMPATFSFSGSVDSVSSSDTQMAPYVSGTFDCYTNDAGTTQENLMSIDFGTLSMRVVSGFVIKGDTQT